MTKLPKARTENIVVRNLSDEVLIYDSTTNQAFCLNDMAGKVFNACDGKKSFDELKSRHKFTDEIIYLALDELKKNNLLISEYTSPFAGMNRREVIKKVGLASMVMLPVITGIVAPTAAMAASACPPVTFVRNVPDGCSASNISSGSSCAGQTDTSRSSDCNSFAGARFCTSGRAKYGGTCTDNPNGTSVYSCVCGA